MRLLLFLVGLMTFISAVLLTAGCLDDMPTTTAQKDGSVVAEPTQHMTTLISANVRPSELQESPDAGEPSPDLSPPPPPDLMPADLAGLVDCYGKAYCDVATMFCLRFFGGTPGKPQPEKVSPSCYAPQDPCANATLDCACIQADAVLGPSCAECFDNKDGTFTCYAQ